MCEHNKRYSGTSDSIPYKGLLDFLQKEQTALIIACGQQRHNLVDMLVETEGIDVNKRTPVRTAYISAEVYYAYIHGCMHVSTCRGARQHCSTHVIEGMHS